jgi:hypothetical protein
MTVVSERVSECVRLYLLREALDLGQQTRLLELQLGSVLGLGHPELLLLKGLHLVQHRRVVLVPCNNNERERQDLLSAVCNGASVRTRKS